MCNCIKTIRERFIQQSGIKYMKFDLDDVRSYSPEGKQIGGNKTGQRVFIGEEKLKKDGSKELKERKSFIAHTYCPFCGKKY